MNLVIANSLYGYFEALYNLNRDVIALCGMDVINHRGLYDRYIESIILTAPRLVPYSYNKKAEIYVIKKSDGLMEFSSELPYLKNDYETILQHHYFFLRSIKRIRDRLEHQMHGAQNIAASSGNDLSFELTYLVHGEELTLTILQLIEFVKELNIMFSKLQQEVKTFAFEQEKTSYAYYYRLTRFDFLDFNKIYESKELIFFGKSLLPF